MADPRFIPGIAGVEAISGIGGVSPVSPISPPATSVPSPSSGRGKTAPIEVGAYWIDRYKRCKQKQLDFGDALAARFAAAMRRFGHKVAFLRGNEDASPRQWDAWRDKNAFGIDTVEFVFLATHSGTHGFELSERNWPMGRPQGVSNWLYWWLCTFDSPDGCWVSTIKITAVKDPRGYHWEAVTPATPVVTMRLGEGRLRWLVLDGCRSLQLGVENERDKDARAKLAESNPQRTWGRCFDGVNMIFGFTGLSSDASWTSDRGLSFGYRAGRGEALADAWIDEAYSWKMDDVPVAVACGRSEADADKRLKAESLRAVGQRLRSGDIGWYQWIWRS